AAGSRSSWQVAKRLQNNNACDGVTTPHGCSPLATPLPSSDITRRWVRRAGPPRLSSPPIQEDAMDRRRFVIGSAAAAATLNLTPSFGQAGYPTQPVILINPFPPGGAADVVGRPFAAAIEPLLKQPV